MAVTPFPPPDQDMNRLSLSIARVFILHFIFRRFSSLKLIHWDIIQILTNNGFGYLPDLDEIVFSCTAYNPWLIDIPAEIGEMVCVATMHEQTVKN